MAQFQSKGMVVYCMPLSNACSLWIKTISYTSFSKFRTDPLGICRKRCKALSHCRTSSTRQESNRRDSRLSPNNKLSSDNDQADQVLWHDLHTPEPLLQDSQDRRTTGRSRGKLPAFTGTNDTKVAGPCQPLRKKTARFYHLQYHAINTINTSFLP